MFSIILRCIFSILAISYICLMFKKGYGNAKRLETVCTETIIADVTNFNKHRFLLCKYYQATCEFTYNGEKYSVKKGIFEDIDVNSVKQIELHINPNNPQDAYIKPLSERCRKANAGLLIAFSSLILFGVIIAVIWLL